VNMKYGRAEACSSGSALYNPGRRSLVQIQPPLPISRKPNSKEFGFWGALLYADWRRQNWDARALSSVATDRTCCPAPELCSAASRFCADIACIALILRMAVRIAYKASTVSSLRQLQLRR